jgi:3'-phosphoadenosine 5'-phosphosulfate sulfotransferase (PAPS reductase)/FAD synthetase
MVQIQEASRSDLVLRMIAAAARDHGPAVFVLDSSAEDLLIAHIIVNERLDVELVTLDMAHAFQMRERLADACDCARTQVRRVDALDGALFGKNAWITSRRAGAGNAVAAYDYDETHGVLRFNPLAAWSEAHVREYFESKGVALSAPAAPACGGHVQAEQRVAA